MTEHFIIGGAQRSGTTYLYKLLEQHPDICMATPLRPEPKYFLDPRSADNGYPAYLAAHFRQHPDGALLGEKSTSYIERHDATLRIRQLLPDARLVFLLREPAERAWSNWCFSRTQGIEPLSFEDALAEEENRLKGWDQSRYSVSPFAYAARGHYPRYLERWAAHFPRENITLLTSESVFADLAPVRTLLAWLGVDPDVPLQLPAKVNATVEQPGAPQEVLRELRQRYHADRATLAEQWGLELDSWSQ